MFEVGEGALYAALQRLERDGLVASSWTQHAGRKRRVYSLTRSGVAALDERRGEWRVFARGMNGALEGKA